MYQNGIYCVNFLNDSIWKLRLCFIPKATCSVCRHVVSFLFAHFFLTAWEPDVWPESTWLVRHSNSNKGGRVFVKGQLCVCVCVSKYDQKCLPGGSTLVEIMFHGRGLSLQPTKKKTRQKQYKSSLILQENHGLGTTLQGHYYLWFFMS